MGKPKRFGKEFIEVPDLKAKYVQRFKETHKRETGEDLSNAEALGYFEDLITLVKAVYKPIPLPEERKRPINTGTHPK